MQAIHDAGVRSVNGLDLERLGRFLRRLSPATVRARYLGGPPMQDIVLEREVSRMLSTDRSDHTVLVAVANDEIRGVAEYIADTPGRAEIAIVVEDEFHGRGIGKSLFQNLACRAQVHGIQMFTGDVATTNHRMLTLLRRGGHKVRLQSSYTPSASLTSAAC